MIYFQDVSPIRPSLVEQFLCTIYTYIVLYKSSFKSDEKMIN